MKVFSLAFLQVYPRKQGFLNLQNWWRLHVHCQLFNSKTYICIFLTDHGD